MKIHVASTLVLSIVAFMSCGTQPTVDRSTFTGEYRPTMTNTVIDTPKETVEASGTTFTMDDVATHNTAESCYFVIEGKVYDVTDWVSKHPGGQASILENCGTDVSNASDGHPGGAFDSTKLAPILTEYYLGDIAS